MIASTPWARDEENHNRSPTAIANFSGGSSRSVELHGQARRRLVAQRIAALVLIGRTAIRRNRNGDLLLDFFEPLTKSGRELKNMVPPSTTTRSVRI